MKRKTILIVILIFLVFMTGCNSERIENKKLNINNYNKQVEFISEQYTKSIDKSKKIEKDVIEGLFSNKINAESISSYCSSEIKENIRFAFNDINYYVENLIIQEESYQNMLYNAEENLEEIEFYKEKVGQEILKGIKDIVTCYYLINGESGVLEQTFIFNLNSGNHGLFSLYWVDGKCFDTTYKTTGGGL